MADFLFLASGVRMNLATGRGQAIRTGQTFRLRGIEKLGGSVRHDVLLGTGRNERIDGVRGADTIRGRGGDDRLLGFVGDDIIRGQGGDDRLIGQAAATTSMADRVSTPTTAGQGKTHGALVARAWAGHCPALEGKSAIVPTARATECN